MHYLNPFGIDALRHLQEQTTWDKQTRRMATTLLKGKRKT